MVHSPRATDRFSDRLPANVDVLAPTFAAGPRGSAWIAVVICLLAGTVVMARPPVGSATTAAAATGPPARIAVPNAPRPARRGSIHVPKLLASSAIVVDAATGRVFFAKRADASLPIASLAKIMTALLVIEHGDLGATVVVSERAAFAGPFVVGLRPRERISARALLFGMLLRSGNDAAVALAEHVSGTVQAFVALMDRRARSLGLLDTQFVDPAGLDDRGYSTAGDLAVLARVALADRAFAQIVNTDRFVLRDGPGPGRVLWNINLFRGQYQGAVGVKTGFTTRAGQCLVAAARRNGVTLIAVVLGEAAATHWQAAFEDAARLLDYGFALAPSRLS